MLVRATNFLKMAFVTCLRQAFGSDVTPAEYRYSENENDPNCKLRIYRAFPQRMFRPPCLIVTAEAADAKIRYLDEEHVKDIYGVVEEVLNDNVSVVPVYRINSVKDVSGTLYTEGTDFTLDYKTGKFTWINTRPPQYFCDYETLTFIDKFKTIPVSRIAQSQLEVPVTITVYALRTTDRERLTDLVILYTRYVFREKFKPYMTYLNIRVKGETQTTWDNQPLFSNAVTIDCWTQYKSELPQKLFDLISQINLSIEVEKLTNELP